MGSTPVGRATRSKVDQPPSIAVTIRSVRTSWGGWCRHGGGAPESRNVSTRGAAGGAPVALRAVDDHASLSGAACPCQRRPVSGLDPAAASTDASATGPHGGRHGDCSGGHGPSRHHSAYHTGG